ncbi:MAG: ImmA/IrrE family metallo-endopeptidase [Acidobacteria bacterium]|nr:ImmA/IrrE family metallo-endopeptidase [Acidobacteriota bacterium]
MTTPARFRPAADLLRELGVTEPDEIEIEAIAQHCGATVTYSTLSGSEARIVGADDNAIITVNRNASRGRERFSAAHELAHWLRDAGEVALLCSPDDVFDESAGTNTETRANDYAADLLLPKFMFAPRSMGRSMTLGTVSDLAAVFTTSLTATAIRLVQLGSFPAVVVVSDANRMRWFRRGPDVPGSLWLHVPGRKTFAHDIFKRQAESGSGNVYVDEWLSGAAERHSIHEDSRRLTDDLVLSMLWWTDETPLEEIVERDEGRAARRSDWRDE